MTRAAFIFFIVIAAGSLAWVCFDFHSEVPGIASLLVGAGWIALSFVHQKWVHAVGLFSLTALAAAGFFLGLPSIFLLIGSVCAFIAWDLADFADRLSLASAEDDTSGLERRHFGRLALVIVTGGVLILVVLRLPLRIPFEGMAVLMVFGIWGMGLVIRRLLEKRD